MNLTTEPYYEQVKRWPKTGHHILAHYNDKSIVVYQAYSPSIGNFAATHGYFGGEFRLDRMSWIKTNFLWMMYRSGWGTKINQEIILAIWIKREAFDYILEQAIHSTFIPEIYKSREKWKELVKKSNVRLQWDPDHDPSGKKCQRRAIQLGLRLEVLKKYSKEWIVEIKEISSFVAEQRQNAKIEDYSKLKIPQEMVYPVTNPTLAKNLGLSKI
ncbi:MAG: DUF4291 domain-containing protein [Candidatus Helarchaeota archaeon]|nr:DUF4291 domain-containing protein [Candidatus Helarchaeota archaeon]